MNVNTPKGTLSRIYVDREHVKKAQGDARPWIVENDKGKWRCAIVHCINRAYTQFDINAEPALWLETRRSLLLINVEVLTCEQTTQG
jgi:hypothetical protein